MGGVKSRAFDADWMKFPKDAEGRANGPVVPYKLSEDELAELKKRLPKPTGKAPAFFNLPTKKRKEAEDMQEFEMYAESHDGGISTDNVNAETKIVNATGQAPQESPENKDLPVSDNKGRPDSLVQAQKTRYETFQEKLTKEQYMTLRAEGLFDKQILEQVGLPYWPDVLARWKRNMDVNGLGMKKAAPPTQTLQPDLHQEEPNPRPSAGLTIAAAMELREDLAEDIEGYDCILDLVSLENIELTDRVIRALTWQRDMHRQAMDRINEVFEKTVLQL